MSVHSLDWDEVLNKKHVTAASRSLPDTPSESEVSESSAGDVVHEPYDPSELSESEREEPQLEDSDPEASEPDHEEPGSKESSGSLPPLYPEHDSAASLSSDISAEPDGYQPHPALAPWMWGDLLVDKKYRYDWGQPQREEDWLGWTIDPPEATPIWRHEEELKRLAEYRILAPLFLRPGSTTVEQTAYYLEEATYFVLGLTHHKKLSDYQTQVLLWKHLSSVWRTLYHLAVTTEQYNTIVDLLLEISHISIVHPATSQQVEYFERSKSKGRLWKDLPILYVTILDELSYASHHALQGEFAPATDPRRTHLERVIIFSAKMISRLNLDIPPENQDDSKTESPYLQAGKFFKAAFGRLQNWKFPRRLLDDEFQGFGFDRPMPRPTEWVIRGAALWMIHCAKFFRQKISENEKALRIRSAQVKADLERFPYEADEPFIMERERSWFPPWDHGPEMYRYPGSDIWIDGYSEQGGFDFDDWQEWSKAKGLNEFREKSWKAWADGFIALLDAVVRGENDIFAGGKEPSRSTQGLIRQALTAMSEADELNKKWIEFEETVEDMAF